jgi:hypothetical protein
MLIQKGVAVIPGNHILHPIRYQRDDGSRRGEFALLDTQPWAQLIVAGVMGVPALAPFMTMRLITHEKVSTSPLRIGSRKPKTAAWILFPLIFFLVYAMTGTLGLCQPDWQLTAFIGTIASSGTGMSAAPSLDLVIGGMFAASLFASVWINSRAGFGEVWGGQGYLLPRLMPLGKQRLGLVAFLGMISAVNIFFNEMTLHDQSAILAGWMQGETLFNSQAYSIWRLAFPPPNPLLGGITGLVGIFCIRCLGWGQSSFSSVTPLCLSGNNMNH